jgi:rare lipoprotein A (peptidoglycan hydrolase)
MAKISKYTLALAILFITSVCQAQELIASFYSISSLKAEGTYKYSKGVMANGQKFRDEGLTCACRCYRLGTYLRIISKEKPSNQITVKVTDRIGRRFAQTRIDLSKRAFEILSGGKLDKGLLQVMVYELK